jgi:hypothetical protein
MEAAELLHMHVSKGVAYCLDIAYPNRSNPDPTVCCPVLRHHRTSTPATFMSSFRQPKVDSPLTQPEDLTESRAPCWRRLPPDLDGLDLLQTVSTSDCLASRASMGIMREHHTEDATLGAGLIDPLASLGVAHLGAGATGWVVQHLDAHAMRPHADAVSMNLLCIVTNLLVRHVIA